MCGAWSTFSPPEDQRINVTAKLGVPRTPPGYGGTAGRPPPAPGGSLTLRYQPSPDQPYTFFDIKARARGATSSAALRACLFDSRSNLAVWAEQPVVATNGSGAGAARAAGLRLGAKYVTPGLSVGAVVSPGTATLSHAFVVRAPVQFGAEITRGLARHVPQYSWAAATPARHMGSLPRPSHASRVPPQVGKVGGLVLGMQTAPMLQLDTLFAGGGVLDRPAWAAAARQCQLATSYAVPTSPPPGASRMAGASPLPWSW